MGLYACCPTADQKRADRWGHPPPLRPSRRSKQEKKVQATAEEFLQKEPVALPERFPPRTRFWAQPKAAE